MSTSTPARAVTLIGAGLAGSLLAILMARRGHRVRLYERRADLRQVEQDSGRSINMALAARGIAALEAAGMMDRVRPLLIPMPGRMLHDEHGQLSFMAYGQRPHEVIHSVSRPGLNKVLLTAAKEAGVQIEFERAATGADFQEHRVTFHEARSERIEECPMETVIATDGAGSVLRHAMVEQLNIHCTEDLLEHGYKELTLPPLPGGVHRIETNALHIWPRGGFMLIALPNIDGSFTVTLFLPHHGEVSFDTLNTAERIDDFFRRHFPDAHALMPKLVDEFMDHPVGIMGTVRCAQWAHQDRLLLLGDAAHAITPFHGQGMNCAFEDCRELDEALADQSDWVSAIAAFEQARRPNANAIADMALENYLEMRDTVRDPQFQLHKALSLALERRFPERFVPRYSMVSFHPQIPYAVAMQRGRIQQQILNELTAQAGTLDAVDFKQAAILIEQRLSPIAHAAAGH